MIIFYVASFGICVIWLYMLVYFNYTMRCLPVLKKQVKPIHYDDAGLPMMSIIVPACNEEEHLEQSLLSRLNQDYPRFELIVINDRSTVCVRTGRLKILAKFDHSLLFSRGIEDGG